MSNNKQPEIRVKVAAVDRLLLLTEAQLKVWLWYKRREGTDKNAYGKAKTIADACGFTKPTSAQSVKNTRAWLVKNGWLQRNGRSRVGLPQFLAVIPRLPLGASEGNPQITPPVIVGLTPPSSTDYTEVVSIEVATLKDSALTSGKEVSKEDAPLADARYAVAPEPEKEKTTPEQYKGMPYDDETDEVGRVWSIATGHFFKYEIDGSMDEIRDARQLIDHYGLAEVKAVLHNTLSERPKSAGMQWTDFTVFARNYELNRRAWKAWQRLGNAKAKSKVTAGQPCGMR